MPGFGRSLEFRPFLHAVGPFVNDIEEMQHYQVIKMAVPAAPSLRRPIPAWTVFRTSAAEAQFVCDHLAIPRGRADVFRMS